MDSDEKSYARSSFPAHAKLVDWAYRSARRPVYPWLDPAAAAAYLGMTPPEFEATVKDGRIIFLALGDRFRAFRFNRSDLDIFAGSEFLRAPAPKLRGTPGFPRAAADGIEARYDRFLDEQRRVVDGEAYDRSSGVGWVYFLEGRATGRIKIGHTSGHPGARRNTLQSGSPAELVPLGLVRGVVQVEQAIHRCFPELRWQREWFNDGPRLRRFIRAFAESPTAADEARGLSMHADDAEALQRETLRAIRRWKSRNPTP